MDIMTMDIVPDVLAKASSWLSLLPRISLRNIWEIVIISLLVYEILVWIKNTRAWNLLKGLLVILAFAVAAAVLRLSTILWIIRNFTTIAVTALLVVFQPELRKALEQLGSKNLLSNILSFDDGKENMGFNDKTINELTRATFEMAKVKTGALMVIERGTSLKEIERTGIEINGLVTSQLLINIFEHNTPLHDGAVVIRGNRIAAATCYLPLSDKGCCWDQRDIGQPYDCSIRRDRTGVSGRGRFPHKDHRCGRAEDGPCRCKGRDGFHQPV